MMPAIVIALGVFALVKLVTRKPSPVLTSGAMMRSEVIGDPRTRHLRSLHKVIQTGRTPKRWHVEEAMREAYDLGDYHVVAKLAAFQTQPRKSETPSPEPSEPPTESIGVVIGKNSPIEGISNDDWMQFVDKLKTQIPSYKDDKHRGAWHHNNERLSELGISDLPDDEDAQYNALERDIADRNAKCQKLIREYCGDHVDVNGEPHPITLSGMLGLIKSAGPKGAQMWIADDADRKAHPKTTEMFLRTNGLF